MILPTVSKRPICLMPNAIPLALVSVTALVLLEQCDDSRIARKRFRNNRGNAVLIWVALSSKRPSIGLLTLN